MVRLDELKDIYIDIAVNKLKTDSSVVFGEGKTEAELVLIGEAPGEMEDRLGKPFVGKAGKNLDQFLSVLEINREDIYITNVVKVRPYKINPTTGRKSNRPPTKEEVEISKPILFEQLKQIKPSIVVTLGNVALKVMMQDDRAVIGDCHGKAIHIEDMVLFPLYHPASIIYNRSLQQVYEEDLMKLKNFINDRDLFANVTKGGRNEKRF